MNMVSLWKIFCIILRHPLGRKNKLATIKRFLRWQLGSRILNATVAMPFIGNTRLLVKSGMHGATMNLYVGIQEFEDVAFLLHLLRPEDTFIDVGANVGVYTVLAAGVRQATVIAVEPVPVTYDEFLDNINLNRLSGHVTAHNIGLAAKEGELHFSASHGPMNHVLQAKEHGPSVIVTVKTLDVVAAGSSPVLMKIDVEGFEQEVIQGGRNLLSKPSLLALIVEFNGLGAQYGFDDRDTDMLLREYGFISVQYAPFERQLTEIPGPNATENTLYIRPSAELDERLKVADLVEIHGFVF